jgi:hypothetical protein
LKKGCLYLLLNLKNEMNQRFKDLSISEPGDYQLLFEIAVIEWRSPDAQAILTLTSDIRVTGQKRKFQVIEEEVSSDRRGSFK